jgi:hypothetical protein
MQEIKPEVAKRYWPGFDSDSLTPSLLYFDDSLSWLAFSDRNLFNDNVSAKKIICPGGLSLYRLNKRLDSIPFHMENKMSFSDPASPSFYNPIMYCSHTERTRSLIPEVESTEEWLQMVLHEYFHAFQFSHTNSIDYLADSLKIGADTLNRVYKFNKWFSSSLENENNFLLEALNSHSRDSVLLLTKKFLVNRQNRRKEYMRVSGTDITSLEKFWEKIEGTARYVEYNTGFIYADNNIGMLESCDTLFNGFKGYKGVDFVKQPWFYKKTEMMQAYYYVTGFNLCRLMDKLGISYKDHLFDQTVDGLEDYLTMSMNK